MECDIDAYIPAAYIKNEYQKLDIYKRISAIETEDEYMDMQDELLDRFGDIPKSVENLLVIARVRALAHKCYVTEVLVKEKEVKHYALTADGQDSLGMICGGQVTVVFERV